MVIVLGLLSLISMCACILILASLAISLHERKQETDNKNEPFSYLFEVYNEK
ncbi:hypothetical protein ABEW19_17815 [Paenibacillus illinoisensis]|uniref:hypothetical protein n=1 Tax=Paenibacillus illinoisensis TaxID=59845 RepID=UPI0013E3DD2B|nr:MULTISPECIES: hypothetical protein [Paenibacillus]